MEEVNIAVSENKPGPSKREIILAKVFIALSLIMAGFILARAIHFYIVGSQSLVFGHVPYHIAIILLPLYFFGIIIRRVWSFYIAAFACIGWICIFVLSLVLKHLIFFLDEELRGSVSFIDFEIRLGKWLWLWALSVIVLFFGLVASGALLEQKYGRKIFRWKDTGRKRRFISLPELLIAVAIVGLFLGVFLPAMSHPTVVDPKPKLPPQESNRVYHPKGFSIIAPTGWLHKIRMEPNDLDRIAIYPEWANKARFSTRLLVTLYRDVNDVNNYNIDVDFKKSKFHEFDAMVFEGDSHRYYCWEAIFSQDEKWYGVELMLPTENRRYEKVPDYWRPFIDSFRIEPNEPNK